jgi:FMN phosphatase YigB (HAD superfamily)
MIGDSLSSDIRGANRVGIDSIWLNNNFDGVINDKPTYEVTELKEIINLFKI